MGLEDEELKRKAVSSVLGFATGTVTNMGAIFATLPLDKATILRQSSQASYPSIFRQIATREGIRQVYSVKQAMFYSSLARSFTYGGVNSAVREWYGKKASPLNEASPLKVGLVGGMLSAFFESGVSAYERRNVVPTFANQPNQGKSQSVSWRFLFTPDGARLYRACLYKNMVANPLTMTAINVSIDLYQRHTPVTEAYSHLLGGMTGAAIANFGFIGLVNLETRVAANPTKSWATVLGEMTIDQFFLGVTVRAAHRAFLNGMMFFSGAAIAARMAAARAEEEQPVRSIKLKD